MMVYQKEHYWCRCVTGKGPVLPCIPEPWGRLFGEPMTACCCSCCIIHDNMFTKKVLLTVVPVATSLRSWLELMMQETLVAESSHKIHTCNSTEAGRKADGKATVAPQDQMQFISVSFLHFNAPACGKLLLGNPASLLHHCSAVLLLPLAPFLAPGLGRAMLTCGPSNMQAEILALPQFLEAGGSHVRKMRMWRTLSSSALPSAFWVLSLVREVLVLIVQFFFCLCGCYSL